jgi:predicted HAD superfamily phosphohydrolase YqeG
MNVFFDVDDTIVCSDGGQLRPLVREVFADLKRDGHVIYIWSGVGLRWQMIDRHLLRPYITDCFVKPLSNHRASLGRLGIKIEPDFVVDDYQEVVDAFAGHAIKPYEWPNPADRAMELVYKLICNATAEQTRASRSSQTPKGTS